MKTITTVQLLLSYCSSPCRVVGGAGGNPPPQYLEEEGRALQSIVIGMTSIGWVPFNLAFALLKASKLKENKRDIQNLPCLRTSGHF